MKFCCEECGIELTGVLPILVDEHDLPPLDFCSWLCLMTYAVKKYNREQPTTKEVK